MLRKQADRLVRTDWNQLGIKAFAEECHSLFSSDGEMFHEGNVKLLGDNNKNMPHVDVRSLKWGRVEGQGFSANNESYVDVREASTKRGGIFGAVRRVYQSGLGLIGGIESRPVDYTDGSIVGFQLDQNGRPYVQVANGDTPGYRVAITGEKLKSGSMPTPHGPFACTLLRTPDGGATWTSTGETVQVFNPTNDKISANSRVVLLKDPTQDFYLFWQNCVGTVNPVDASGGGGLPADPGCECGGADPSGNFDPLGSYSTMCSDSPTPTVTSVDPATATVTNIPACMTVKFSGVLARCCDECIAYFNLEDDCDLHFVHRNAFDSDPGFLETDGHFGIFGTDQGTFDQWHLVNSGSATARALFQGIELKSGASTTDCTLCKTYNDDNGSYPDDMSVVIYPTISDYVACDDIAAAVTTDGLEQIHNINQDVFFALQIGTGMGPAGGDASTLYYYSAVMGAEPYDMSGDTSISFRAKCALGYFGYNSPNEPPQLATRSGGGDFYSDLWDTTSGCYDGTLGAHKAGTNYNCKHMDNDLSSDILDVTNYGTSSAWWQHQCRDGNDLGGSGNQDAVGHVCATAVATWKT